MLYEKHVSLIRKVIATTLQSLQTPWQRQQKFYVVVTVESVPARMSLTENKRAVSTGANRCAKYGIPSRTTWTTR